MLEMREILDTTETNTWFFNDSARVYRWNSDDWYYPADLQSPQWEWKLNYSYYLHLNEAYKHWRFYDCPTLDSTAFTFVPDSAWAEDPDLSSPRVNRWFFMGYATQGYMKLASIRTTEQDSSGDPDLYSYEGPFHWLIWYNDSTTYYPVYDLKIVKTDEGKCYIPTPGMAQGKTPFDNIIMLEPGRGYFLGFDADAGDSAYQFRGWSEQPIWTNNSVPPTPKSSNPQIASSTHFLFPQYTHWSYPVYIDTVDLGETPMEAGDEVGIFDEQLCVGAAVYTGAFPLVVPTWSDDIATPDLIDGYQPGHEMTFIWFDQSANTESEFTPPPGTMGLNDDPVTPTHSGFGRGLYALRNFAFGTQNLLQLPLEYKLAQNFPNPFNAQTVIPLELPQRSHLKIEIFNIRGQSLGTIYDGVQNAGWPRIRYEASRLASGIYFYRITAEGLERGGKFIDVRKMVLIK